MIKFDYPAGATPIDGDELYALIPNITQQSELDQFERENIRSALRWAEKSRKLRKDLLSLEGLQLLHQKMFENVWAWAGKFRTTEKNIGKVFSHQVSEEVHKLCEDFKFQITRGIEDWNLLAVNFHHRLVSIHPFPNGNGRHARLAADLLLTLNGQKPLSWGLSDLSTNDETRREYIQALQAADRGDLNLLYLFAMSRKR